MNITKAVIAGLWPLYADGSAGADSRAMMFTAQAFGRIVADTSWDRSPRVFIIMAAIAIGFWAWWCIASWRIRRLGPKKSWKSEVRSNCTVASCSAQ